MSKVNVEIDSHVNEIFSTTRVTQKFKNQSYFPIKLKILIIKNEKIFFSSFNAKIGNLITVQSKVIKKEKAEIIYEDNISSVYGDIFVSEDPDNENIIIINMGNIPFDEEVIFISEFIQFTEASKSYEFEIFRNLPIFTGQDEIYQNHVLKGKINIETKNKIIYIEKKIFIRNLFIIEDNNLNEEKNKCSFSYKIEQDSEYLQKESSKIYFEVEFNQEQNEPLLYSQKSKINKNELNYIIHYKNRIPKMPNENQLKIKPVLFIFLIEQSEAPINMASKVLRLFLQSLPAKSYYQIIGFGSSYQKYDETPKECTQENIIKSLEIIDNLRADLGRTDIYAPLNHIYSSHELYDKIKLPKNIFLLTKERIQDKKETLDLIYKNSSKYSIHYIRMGNGLDDDLIKNAEIIGKVSYHYCYTFENINSTIVKAIKNTITLYCENFIIKSSLDSKNWIKNDSIPDIALDNQIINLNYIIKDKNNNHNNKINLEINYFFNEEKFEINMKLLLSVIRWRRII